jgi:hypothetical protein
VIMYVWASFLYPGGSQHDHSAAGFDWLHNYWCDLMGEKADNGEINGASPVAITAQAVLSLALVVFWMICPSVFPDRRVAGVVTVLGVVSMFTCLFLFTSYHDTVIDVAGFTGASAMLLTFVQLYKLGKRKLLFYGILCFIFFGLNYAIYLTRIGIPVLPVIQKFTFLLALGWFAAMNIMVLRTRKGTVTMMETGSVTGD